MAKDKSKGKSARPESADAAEQAPAAKRARTSTSSSSVSKGKERSSDATRQQRDKILLTARGDDDVGPVLVSTGDFATPNDARFQLHHIPSGPMSPSDDDDESGASGSHVSIHDSMILAGETETMDYVAYNWDANGTLANDVEIRRETKGYAGEYMIGVYDPASKSVVLRQAPLFTLTRTVKALKSLALNTYGSFNDWDERVLARRSLGESFGNRKTKARARNEDRMKVDTTNIGDVMDTLRSNIDSTMQGVPTSESMQQEANLQRPIPPPNLTAIVPQEVYTIRVLIGDNVLRMLPTKGLESVESADGLGKFVPQDAANMPWLRERLWTLVQSAQYQKGAQGIGPKKIEFNEDGEEESVQEATASTTGILKSSKETARLKLKIALYIGILWSWFRGARGGKRGGDREDLLKRLRLGRVNGGEPILDDLFERFSQKQRGEKRGMITNFTETKLYAYIFALCMHLDDFSLDPLPLARDLGMPSKRASEIFKSLGCSTKRFPSLKEDQKQQVRVILNCPVQLPKPRRGRAT